MALTELKIKAAKPQEKPYKLADEKGMYLLIQPSGGKLWRLDYRYEGKRKTLALSTYPEVTLADARGRRDAARRILARGEDPGAIKRAQKACRAEQVANSFEVTARRWHEKNESKWSESYAYKTIRMLERDVFPWIGATPIVDLDAPKFLTVARRVEGRGHVDTAHRAMQLCGQVMRFGVAEGLVSRDPTGDLRGALSPVETTHLPSVTDPKRAAEILRMLDAFSGSFPVQCALKLAPLVFTRPGELRKARWVDIDLDDAMWSIPAEAMKMREPHLVPLSSQAVTILKELHPYSGHGEYVFPGGRDPKRPMSDAAINAALRRLGIDTKNELTGHGFRAMARTILHEQLRFEPDVIEQQLAHKTPGPLGAAYARAKFIDQRKVMMQAWADYLDRLVGQTEQDQAPIPVEDTTEKGPRYAEAHVAKA